MTNDSVLNKNRHIPSSEFELFLLQVGLIRSQSAHSITQLFCFISVYVYFLIFYFTGRNVTNISISLHQIWCIALPCWPINKEFDSQLDM